MIFYYYHRTLGNQDQAYNWLEKAIVERDSGIPFFALQSKNSTNPVDPRIIALLEKAGL